MIKDAETNFELEVGFRQDPNDATKKIHYCDAVIGGTPFNWNIPEPERGTESGIRYGAYRVKGGRAQIRWANTTYQKAEIVDDSGANPPLANVFRLRNLVTGKFLTDVGVGGQPVIMTDSGEAPNTHWTFAPNGSFYNIDSQTFGILRGPGSGGSGGPYVVLCTSFEPGSSQASNSDKVWRLYYNETEDTYRFEQGTSSRYLYHDVNGTITNVSVPETDSRSVWEAISTNVTLGISENNLKLSGIKVYPNPAVDSFTIHFKNEASVEVKIYDILGKEVFKGKSQTGLIEIKNDKRFPSGLYLIKVLGNNNQEYHDKLIVT